MNIHTQQRISTFLLLAAGLSSIISIVLLVKDFNVIATNFKILFDYATHYNPDNDLSKQLVLNDILRQGIIQIIVSLCVTTFFWFSYFVRHDFFLGRSLWEESAGISLIFMVATLSICYFAILYDDNKDMDIIINREKNLESFCSQRVKHSKERNETPPLFISTGIFLQSIEFTNSNNCVLTAYVWQKYEKGLHDSLSRGFILPEAQEVEIQEAYRKIIGNTEVIGWSVKATIREVFDFRNYPFDHQNLWIRFWHKDFDKNVILVPDLKAYSDYKPNKLPGIEKFMVLPSWDITNAFFGYLHNDYNANFGIDTYVGLEKFPELYYNIFIQRQFISIFISDLVPIIMTIFILFMALVVAYREEESANEFFKFNVMEVVSLIAALIFVVILAHIELRSRINTDNVLYVEYYYFIVYVAIFIVLANYLILHKQYKIQFVTAKDNYYPKVLFLPAITFAILVITVFTFY